MASKRKLIVSREPNGRPQRAVGEDREYPPTKIKRLRDAAMRRMEDPQWGTELGRLSLQKVITDEQYEAGKWWSKMAAQFHVAIEAFPVRSAAIEFGRGGAKPDPDSPEGQRIAKREANQAEDFFAAHAVLVQSGCENVVRRLCEQDEGPCGMGELISVRRGLSVLADHRGLTNHRKSGVISVR